ncbi:CheR family methyltransferase [Roseococcus sp. YIM B11640]|uniref:CheR family methyltransferase n=1 Tax=Roseococcus sp. YIM B11640 TaxID=3133973 RepID=UPI003C7A7094
MSGLAAAAPAAETTEREAAAMAALEALAGFAASPVLLARLRRAASLVEACDLDHPDVEEPHWAALLDAVTVQETRLYRHPAQCAGVAALLPGRLAAARAEGRKLRILSAGCATGEEAFTLAAMALSATRAVPGAGIEVLGLDLCRPALASAEAGVIHLGMGDPLALVPAADRPWFQDASQNLRLHPSLRRVLQFSRANLLGWSETGFDVVFCRNVLIYLTADARAEVLRRLVASLAPGGILALGPTDRGSPELFPAGEALWTAHE